jgi:hypothetical protein
LLPKNYSFIYASSDAGAEELINKAIRLADKTADRVLQEIEFGRVAIRTQGGNPPYMEAVRLIYGRGSEVIAETRH